MNSHQVTALSIKLVVLGLSFQVLESDPQKNGLCQQEFDQRQS